MKKRNRIFLLLAMVLLLLAGCGAPQSNEALEAHVGEVIAALNAGDKAALDALYYPGRVEEQEDLQSWMLQIWQGEETYTLHTAHLTTETVNGTTWVGNYVVTFPNWTCNLSVTYTDDSQGQGFDLIQCDTEDRFPISGTLSHIESPLQWFLVAVTVAQFGFVIFTVVDILRRKPRSYGLWAVACLLGLGFAMGSTDGFWMLSYPSILLRVWQYLVYPSGNWVLCFTLPIGVLIYWLQRKKLKPRTPEPPPALTPEDRSHEQMGPMMK